jgi:solute carrier family 13 (sodium-dependent dicarboxylate transporter), member 2/3/5
MVEHDETLEFATPLTRRKWVGLFIAPVIFILMLALPVPEAMSLAAWRTAAVGLLMAMWWITEAVPIPATAVLPMVLFPVLGIVPIGQATAPYANPIIYLFLGGFIIALAMQRWELHRRIALTVVNALGTQPHRLVLGFMVATAFLSMWVSNTATAVMMMPIGLSVIALVAPRTESGELGQLNFGTGLMLGIAYAASVGGLATLIGTPPNALLAGFLNTTYGIEIGFAQWMMVGLPLTLVAIPLVWVILTRLVFPIKIREVPGGRARIRDELRKLGPVRPAERRVGLIFTLTAIAWVTRPLLGNYIPGLNDTSIAIAAALILFLTPAGGKRGGPRFILDWKTAEQLPWGVLILFGGGLSLANAVTTTGLAEWIGMSLSGLVTWPTLLLVVTVTLVIIFLTEMTSNTATAAAFLPVLAPLAVALGQNPFLLVVPAALAASCAFMMPVATPPNAIVYGSGYVTIPQMARAGIILNLVFAALITVVAYTLMMWVFGVTLGETPLWAGVTTGA